MFSFNVDYIVSTRRNCNDTCLHNMLPYYHDITYFWKFTLFNSKKGYPMCSFLFETSLFAWLFGLEIPPKLLQSYNSFFMPYDVGDVGYLESGMFGIQNVRDEGRWGCGMFEMWDVRDMGCLECGMLGMWDVWDVECSGFGMFEMWDALDVGCSKCGMFYKMPKIYDYKLVKKIVNQWW